MCKDNKTFAKIYFTNNRFLLQSSYKTWKTGNNLFFYLEFSKPQNVLEIQKNGKNPRKSFDFCFDRSTGFDNTKSRLIVYNIIK